MAQVKLLNVRRYINQKNATIFLGGIVILFIIAATLWGIKMNQQGLTYSDSGVTITWLPSTVTRWNNKINEQGKRYNVDPNFIAVLMTLESGGYSAADSGFALGLMQVAPSTANEIAQKHLLQKTDHFNLKDPATNIEFGTAYIAFLRNTYCGKDFSPTWNECAEAVAAGYNGGPGALLNLVQGKGLQSIETLSYSRDAMNMWRERSAAVSPTFDRWKNRGGQDLIDKANAEKL